MKKNKIRKDLYYRLNVVNVKISPLRNRKKDISLLTKYFIKKYNYIFNKNINHELNQNIINILRRYNWPGNVRELKNCIESVFNHNNTNLITEDALPDYVYDDAFNLTTNCNNKSSEDKVNNYEKSLIIKALNSNRFNISKTAKKLNIPRSTLYYRIKKFNIDIN